LASRNATREDFEAVASLLEDLPIDLDRWVRRRYPATREGVLAAFGEWSNPGASGVKNLLEREC
jgi:threonine dehydrogenase-like Zn-dependent dehydrogenase